MFSCPRLTVLALILLLTGTSVLAQLQPTGTASTVQQQLLPERHAYYVSLGGFLTGPGFSPVLRASMGHDALFGSPRLLGARITVDKGFGAATQPASIAVDVTWRISQGNVDFHAGAGGGLQFNTPVMPFGEMLLGAGVRLTRGLAPFIEGRYRFYVPDGQNTQASAGSVIVGLQFRRATGQ
jgi:hypothetical protein